MRGNLQCDCHICKVERHLLASLSEPPGSERFSNLALTASSLASFASAVALVQHLHAQRGDGSRAPSTNEILTALIQSGPETDNAETSQSVLILAFMPTIHRTYREVRAWHRELPTEDIAQQILTYFLQLAASAPVGLIDGQLCFMLARSLRRNALRWAQKETLILLEREQTLQESKDDSEPWFNENFESVSLLNNFLDYACSSGVLSTFERGLLIKLKVEGFLAKEMAHNNTVLSPKAVQCRIERIIERLQKAAFKMGTKPQSHNAPGKNSQWAKKVSRRARVFSLRDSANFLAIGNSRGQLSLDSSPTQSTTKPQQVAAN